MSNTDKTQEALQATNQQLRASEQQLRAANQQLKANNQQLIAGEQKIKKQAHDLSERVKELECIQNISEIIKIDEPIEKTLQNICNIIPQAGQYSEMTCVKISWGNKEFKTANYKKGKWTLNSDIMVHKKKTGEIEVCDLEQKHQSNIEPFLKEKKALLDTIAEQLGRIIEHKQAEEKLKVTNQQLDASNQQLRASEQQLRAVNQQLEANNQQLIAGEQQLKASNQQLETSEQQLRAANQQLVVSNQQLMAGEQQLRAANQQLMASEKRFKKLSNLTFEGIVIHDKGVVIDVNESFQKMFSYTKEELIGKNIIELLIPTEFHAIIKENIAKNVATPYELMAKKKDGILIPVEIEARDITEKGETVQVAAIRDITERKQSEETLKKSEAKFHSLFSEMAEGVYLHEIIYNKEGTPIDYRIIETNPASENILNIKTKDAVGKLATELYGTPDAPFLEEYAKVAETGIPVNFEQYFSQMKKHFHISVYSPNKGKFATVFSDITERKQTEKVLKKSEERLKILFDSAPDAYYINDIKGTFLDGNKAAEKLLGYKREDLIGKSFLNLKLLSAKELLKASKILVKNVQGKISGPDEFILNRKDGSQVSVEIQTYPAIIENKIVVLGIAHDISQRKQAEKILKKKMNELEIFNEASVDREIKINELRREINELLTRSGKKEKYEIVE